MTAEIFKKQILAVIEVWEDWIVFSPEFTTALRHRLEGADIPSEVQVEGKEERTEEQKTSFTSRFKQSSFKLATDAPPVDDVDEDAMDVESNIDGKPADDLDGEAVDDVDGEPVDDVDGEPVNDLDGEPVDDAGEDLAGESIDDIDGMPVDDIDGVPVDDTNGSPLTDRGSPVDHT